ncbi:MAG TPA: NAD(P)H-binding protein [Candidatus Angelobacter sp.]|nr:NAD(P)H-binding protein [Candidatus Angelobacter sp.]
MYVITGATGNTGRVAAEHLLANKEKVRAIGRSAERLQPLAAKGAEPFEADLTDVNALTRAFTGAQAVYAMIPPDVANEDFRAYQDRVSDALVQAIKQAGVKYVVALSSIGADKPGKTGPVVGLREFEEKLNQIAEVNVLHLRPGYFMENTLGQAGTIRAFGKTAGELNGNLKIPMIATFDIGVFAAKALVKHGFTGKQTRELQGPRDLDYNEVTAIIAKAIKKPDLEYVKLPDEQLRPVLLQLGFSGNVADALLEMSASLNSGYMRPLEKRSPQNTTPTSYETFVAERFLPVYNGQSQAA